MSYKRKLRRRLDDLWFAVSPLDLAEELEAFAEAYDESVAKQNIFLGCVHGEAAGTGNMEAVERAQQEFEEAADRRDRAALALAEALFDSL